MLRRIVPAGLVMIAGLAACTPRPVVSLPPVELTTCAGEATPPDLPSVDWSSVEAARPIQRQRDELTFDYILRERSAGGDCRAKVAGLKVWREAMD